MAKLKVYCKICNKPFYIFPCRKGKTVTCSPGCMAQKASISNSLPKRVRDVAVSLYKQGNSIRYTAAKVGVDACTIRIWLKKNNIKIRSNAYPLEVKTKTVGLYLDGMPINKIVSECKVTKISIRRWTKIAGIPRRRKYYGKSKDAPCKTKTRASIDYFNWRTNVLVRDEWTCQSCGQVGKDLHCHHIISFANNPDLRFIANNGITLCKDCHIKLHKKIRIGVAS